MPPIHPGEYLRDELEELDISARAFADALGVPHNRIAAILRGDRAVTADTALRLAAWFGTSADVNSARSNRNGVTRFGLKSSTMLLNRMAPTPGCLATVILYNGLDPESICHAGRVRQTHTALS